MLLAFTFFQNQICETQFNSTSLRSILSSYTLIIFSQGTLILLCVNATDIELQSLLFLTHSRKNDLLATCHQSDLLIAYFKFSFI